MLDFNLPAKVRKKTENCYLCMTKMHVVCVFFAFPFDINQFHAFLLCKSLVVFGELLNFASRKEY